MFKNEVTVSLDDKHEMIAHIMQVKSILDKYPWCSCDASTVTVMQRAKGAVEDVAKWIGYLYTHDDSHKQIMR